MNEDFLNKYHRLLNNCIRFVFDLRKYDHASFFILKLNYLPIRQRRHLYPLTTLYTILNSLCLPTYLTPSGSCSVPILTEPFVPQIASVCRAPPVLMHAFILPSSFNQFFSGMLFKRNSEWYPVVTH